jgi:hypothetical protein
MQRLSSFTTQSAARGMMASSSSLLQRQAVVVGCLRARGVSYDTGDKKGKVMSLEEEQRIASQQYKDQQKLTPKLDDETVMRFHEPWQGTERRESEMADIEGVRVSSIRVRVCVATSVCALHPVKCMHETAVNASVEVRVSCAHSDGVLTCCVCVCV